MYIKLFLKIWLLSVNLEKFTSMNQMSDQSQPTKLPIVIGRSSSLNR